MLCALPSFPPAIDLQSSIQVEELPVEVATPVLQTAPRRRPSQADTPEQIAECLARRIRGRSYHCERLYDVCPGSVSRGTMPTPKVTASAAGVNRSGQPGHAGYRLVPRTRCGDRHCAAARGG